MLWRGAPAAQVLPHTGPLLSRHKWGYPVQACKLVGGHEVVTLELLPQLVPLFLCPPDQRGDYGSSIPPAAPSATHPARSVCLQTHTNRGGMRGK